MYNCSEQLHTNKLLTMEHQRKCRKSSSIKEKKQGNLKHSTPTKELRQENVHRYLSKKKESSKQRVEARKKEKEQKEKEKRAELIRESREDEARTWKEMKDADDSKMREELGDIFSNKALDIFFQPVPLKNKKDVKSCSEKLKQGSLSKQDIEVQMIPDSDGSDEQQDVEITLGENNTSDEDGEVESGDESNDDSE